MTKTAALTHRTVSHAAIAAGAAELLNEAIEAGRLPRTPDLATLSRIAAIIGPVLAAQRASAAKNKKTARAKTSPAVIKEANRGVSTDPTS